MRILPFLLLVLSPMLSAAQSSGAVAKFGLVCNDFLRDSRSILSMSQAGHAVGLDVLLGAEDRTYFKLGGYYARLHMQPQEHPKETKFFKVTDGFDVFKGVCGLETRLVTLPRFNWRLGAAAAFNLVTHVMGAIRFDDINNAYFGMHFSMGVDLSFVVLDLIVEPGLADFKPDTTDSKPLMMLLTVGLRF